MHLDDAHPDYWLPWAIIAIGLDPGTDGHVVRENQIVGTITPLQDGTAR